MIIFEKFHFVFKRNFWNTVESTWWRHKMETFSVLLALCGGIHRSPLNSPHKGQWCEALIFSLIWAWSNGWVNNRDAGELRRHPAHYDVTNDTWMNLMIKMMMMMMMMMINDHKSWLLRCNKWWYQFWCFDKFCSICLSVPFCYSVICNDDAIKWKHFPRYWPFVRGIHRSPMFSLSKLSRRRWFETPSRYYDVTVACLFIAQWLIEPEWRIYIYIYIYMPTPISPLAQIMACRYSVPSHYPNQCCFIVDWTLGNKLQRMSKQITNLP